MAITTYGELKTAIASWLARSDLTSVIPDFVTLAEADIRRDVRTSAMESLASGTLTGETLAFPTRFLDARRLTVDGYVYEYVPPERYQHIVNGDYTDRVYTIIGTSFYINDGASGSDYTLLYRAGYAAFSANSDTNALLTSAPEIYMYGSLKHASAYMADTDGLAKYSAAYRAAVDRENLRSREQAYTGATLMVRPA